MGPNEGLSDLDLELLGEERSTPVNTNERPVTSPGPVKVSTTKAPTQAGSTNKPGSSTLADRIHVFGTTSPVQAGFTINSVHLPSVFDPVVTPKVSQNPTTNTTPLPSDRQPIFTSRTLVDPTTDAVPLPSGHRSIFMPTNLQIPIMDAEGMSDKTDSVQAELEDSNKANASFTRDEVMELMRKCKKAEKVTEDISKKLFQTEAENTALKKELKESGKKLSSTEGENAELNHRYTRAEEALRVKVEQAVKEGKRAQVTERNFEKLKTEYESLQDVHTVLEHKSKTQSNQVVGCEKKVTKTNKELATYKAAAEAKEARLQQSIANLKKGLEDSRKLIRSSGIEERRAELDGLSAHVDGFEESRRDWVEAQNQLEDDIAAVKAVLDEKEQKILSMVEENKKLMQAKKDLKKANQDLKHQQDKQKGSTMKGAQASSKSFTHTDYSTDEDQGFLNKKPQRSVGEHFHDFGMQSGNDDASEEEEKTVTIRDFKPPFTNQGWTQSEEEKTVILGEYKPTATGDGSTPTQATNLEYSLLFSMDRAPVPSTGTPSQGSKLGRSPVAAVDSAPVSIVGDPLPCKATKSQGVQTELTPTLSQETELTSTQSQGVQTELTSTQSQEAQTEPRATQSQGVQTESRATQSQGVQTELPSTQSQGVQTELVSTQSQGMQTELTYTQSQGVQTELTSTQSQGVQTELTSTQSQGMQTELKYTQSQGVQTELTYTQSQGMQTELTSTQSQGMQTELTYTQSQGLQTEPRATQSQAVQTEPEETTISNEDKPWYLRNYTQIIFGTVMVSALLMLLFWAWSQCQAATKERKMWMQANDHAYRLSDEVIRKQAIAMLLRTPDRARLGWLTPEKIMTLHRGAHQAFTHTFHPLVLPTRSISTASLVQSAMAPTPATTRMGAWPAWSDSL